MESKTDAIGASRVTSSNPGRIRSPLILNALWVVPAALFSTSSAFAYLDPAEVILETVAARRARIGFTTIVAEGITNNSAFVWTVLKANQGYRTELRLPESTAVELSLGADRYDFVRGGSAPQPQRLNVDPFFELLGTTAADPGGERGRTLLARMRINSHIVALDRHDGRPVYIIGARPGQLDRPQLWIDKGKYVPVRWIVLEGQDLVETRLYGYHQPTTGPWFPERVEHWTGDLRQRVVTYHRAQLNVAVERELFVPPQAL